MGYSLLATQLLATQNTGEAMRICQQLQQCNLARRAAEGEILQQAESQIAAQTAGNILFAWGENWHRGILGLIAGRLAEKYKKPVMLVSFDQTGLGFGSARSVGGMDIGKVLGEGKADGFLKTGGGHAMAGGFQVEKNQWPQAKAQISARLGANGKAQDGQNDILWLDGTLALSAVNCQLAEILRIGEPYGIANPLPCFAFAHLHITDARIIADAHVKCRFIDLQGKQISGICFRARNHPLGEALMAKPARLVHIAAHILADQRNRKARPSLQIRDLHLIEQTS